MPASVAVMSYVNICVLMRTSDSLFWKTLRFFHIDKFYRAIKGMLPESVVKVVTGATLQNAHIPLVLANELEPKYALAWSRLQRMNVELGDYLEFGVSIGTSMACMHRVLKKKKIETVRLLGFDSFEGMPPSAATEDLGMWKPGEFASSIDQTRQFLDDANIDWRKTHLIKGWFHETLNDTTTQKYAIQKASMIMVDCDIYSASKTALNYALPFIKDYTMIFFDDWRDDALFGEHRAYVEFLSENMHLRSEDFGEYRPTGRIFLVSNTRNVP